jgi:hypothetical protein
MMAKRALARATSRRKGIAHLTHSADGIYPSPFPEVAQKHAFVHYNMQDELMFIRPMGIAGETLRAHFSL